MVKLNKCIVIFEIGPLIDFELHTLNDGKGFLPGTGKHANFSFNIALHLKTVLSTLLSNHNKWLFLGRYFGCFHLPVLADG